MDARTYGSIVAQKYNMSAGQEELFGRLLSLGFKAEGTETDKAIMQNMKPDLQERYNAYLLGRMFGEEPEAKEALDSPQGALLFMNRMSHFKDFKPSAVHMKQAGFLLETYKKDELKALQESLGVSPDGFIGDKTKTALATFIGLEGYDAVKRPKTLDRYGCRGVTTPITTQSGKTVRSCNYIDGDYGNYQSKIDHLVAREGAVFTSYKDSEGHLTAGVGHKLSAEEAKLYPEGTDINAKVVRDWLKKDFSKAHGAAMKQAKELGIKSQDFTDALSNVNFQMGTGWRKEFNDAWKYLVAKDYASAQEEVKFIKKGSKIKSGWNKQTPKRVADFVEAIERLK